MLQRAASNACSWWWASHIRTKQSRWLDTDLEEMEERVKSMLKIVEQDGDSFAKKAEIYFKKRPELVHFVEETYKAYQALADRYDHISSELHKANHTIATAFPDQIQFDMQDEDFDDIQPKAITSIDPSKIRKPSIADIVPQLSLMNKRKENPSSLKKSRLPRVASQNSKAKAKEEIDKLQKGILVLQTEKEFIKSSYETSIAKYLDIEKQITEMQEGVFLLQDECSASVVIEDDEARALMAVTALKSCEDSLNKLQEQQKKSMEEARIDLQRIKSFQSEEITEISNGSTESQCLSDVVKHHIEISSETSVVELAEKINELVTKVIQLELHASSQTAQVKSLSSEADMLHRNLRGSEEEKKTLIEESKILREKLEQAEDKLQKTQNFERHIQDERSVHENSVVTRHSIDDISSQSQESTSLNNTEAETVSEKEAKETSELEGFEDFKFEDNFSAQNEEAPRDSGRKEVEEMLDAVNADSLVEGSQGIQESGHLLKDQSTFDHSESSSHLKEKVEDDNIQPRNESEPKLEKTFDYSEAGAPLNNNSVESQLLEWEAIFSSSLDDDYVHPSKKSKTQVENSISRSEAGNSMTSPVAEKEAEMRSSQEDCNINPFKEPGYEDQEVSLNWLQSLVNGVEGKEKMILSEYTSILRNYKDLKKRLSEAEKKNQEFALETAIKDEEIQSLCQRSLLPNCNNNAPQNFETTAKKYPILEAADIKLPATDARQTSAIEEKFRRDIDTVLEENLEFWLRFSTSFHNIQKFEMTFEELQAEIKKLRHRKLGESSSSNPENLPIGKRLRELKTELQVWLEQNSLLQGELKTKFSSLSNIQEEISATLEACLEASLEADVVKFAPYQAAKFQGELLNMQLENNKVAEELKAGIDHVNGLQSEVEKSLSRLNKKLELPEPGSISGSSNNSNKNNHEHLSQQSTKNRVPLRSFLFSVKPKKKQSIFACVHPALQKHMPNGRSS